MSAGTPRHVPGRRLSRRALIVGSVAAGGGALLACDPLSRDSAASDPVASGTGVGISFIPIAKRVKPNPVRGTLLTGQTYDSTGSQPAAVVYNVWGSWCGPCREEAPELARAARRLSSSGVRFIGINVRDNAASARAFERRYRVPYSSITTATSGEALLAFGRELPPNAVPMSLIIDRSGRVGTRIVGPTTYGPLTRAVQRLLSESGP